MDIGGRTQKKFQQDYFHLHIFISLGIQQSKNMSSQL